MAGAAYFRARALLREQVIEQSQNLIITELTQWELEVKTKGIHLDRMIKRGDAHTLLEIAFHTNDQSPDFPNIRNAVSAEFQRLNSEAGEQTFHQFFLLDPHGKIIMASKAEWEGTTLSDPSLFEQFTIEKKSKSVLGMDPLYPGELILLTAVEFKTGGGGALGMVVGVTETESLQEILQSLTNLNPLASTYFIVPPATLVSSDPYTGELKATDASASQREQILPALDAMMHEEEARPAAVEFEDRQGNPVLAQVLWLPSMRVGIALEIRQDAIYARLNTLVPFTILLVAVTLTAIGLAITLGANRVIRPLRTLASIAHDFARGNFENRAKVTGNNEISQLAESFNYMADEIGNMYRSLEQKVDERTRQIRTAAEVAQSVTALTNLDELLNKTVELLAAQFDFYQTSIFMVDRAGKYAVLRATHGPAAQQLLEQNYKLEVGSASIIGWVSAHNQPRVASDVAEDPIHLKHQLLPETRSEASVPISIGNLVLGVLDVQSTQAGAFSPETIVMLRTLASQIAAAIQNVGLVEATQVNFQEISRLYRSSHLIAETKSETDTLEVSGRILREIPYPNLVIRVNEQSLEVLSFSDSQNVIGKTIEIKKFIEGDTREIRNYLSGGPVITAPHSPEAPRALREIIQPLGLDALVCLPLSRGAELAGLIVLGAKKQGLTSAVMQPYVNLAELISVTLEKIEAARQTEKRLQEMEALTAINQAVSASTDLNSFYEILLNKIKEIMGDYSFTVALYDESKDTISIPYSYEDNKVSSIASFPLGEGLTSILIRTKQPLLITEDIERRASALGAKVVERPARSWMGAPMLVQSRAVGALIIQDLENERTFDEDDLRFLSALASQLAGMINNIRLLDESKRRALQLETAAEIARDISSSLDLDELLGKAVNFIRERFDFYHAAIFLLDLPGEFAVIRAATGEAGAQMKRAGYKMGVGSKSIVGFVSSRGEQLIVNDTAKDATYYANPLLPGTRAEAAIPLKVGERNLGVLDVQSTHPYAFTEDNLRSLQILADQMAIAVVNSELFAETQEHLSQHRLLHHITTTAASGTTLEEALESAVSGLQVTLGGDRVAILLLDKNRKELEVGAAIGYSADMANIRIPLGSGITGWVAMHRRTLRVNDVSTDPRYIEASPNTRSELAVPLIYRSELLGVLNVESEQADAYTDNDEEMLGTLGGSLAAIIANARLLEQIRQQAERERLIFEATSKIRRSTDIQSILATTASELTKIVGARQTKIRIAPLKDNGSDKGSGA